MPEVERAGERVLIALLHGILAVGAASDGDWSAADAHLAVFSQPAQLGVIDGEIALLAERVARVAADAGDGARAAVALGWARDVWRGLGRDDRIAALGS